MGNPRDSEGDQVARSLIILGSTQRAPKWDHGVRVTPGVQAKQPCAKEEKLEANTPGGKSGENVGLLQSKSEQIA